MAFCVLNDLPLEVQIHICSYLKDAPEDLLSLALTSKTCHDIAAHYMFGSIRVVLRSPQALWTTSSDGYAVWPPGPMEDMCGS